MAESVYEALRESHEIQRAMLRRILRTRPDAEVRNDMFRELQAALRAHESAEERFLYAPILMDDRGLEPSRHALHEHHEIDELVEEVRGLEPSGEAWMEKMKELSKKVHHHLREEEKKFFQLSGKILTDTQKTRLARSYRRDYSRLIDEYRAD